MKARYTRTTEALNKNAKNLSPLKQGDKVFVQNQRGSHPTKWDASGTVMDAGQHDQYTVKIDGTGRVTLCNRRFLCKFTPATLDITRDPRSIQPVQTIPQLTDQPMVADESMNLQPTMLPTEPSADPSPILPPRRRSPPRDNLFLQAQMSILLHLHQNDVSAREYACKGSITMPSQVCGNDCLGK